jgi:hypothetical protein
MTWPETIAESLRRLEIFGLKEHLVQLVRRKMVHARGRAPDRQEADNRNSSACSQRAESYRRPKKEWEREKEKSRVRSRSEFIKDGVTYEQQTNK